MNASQIANELKNKGFEVSEWNGIVYAGLNRWVAIMEIEVALNHQIEREHMFRCGDKVAILGQEE